MKEEMYSFLNKYKCVISVKIFMLLLFFEKNVTESRKLSPTGASKSRGRGGPPDPLVNIFGSTPPPGQVMPRTVDLRLLRFPAALSCCVQFWPLFYEQDHIVLSNSLLKTINKAFICKKKRDIELYLLYGNSARSMIIHVLYRRIYPPPPIAHQSLNTLVL